MKFSEFELLCELGLDDIFLEDREPTEEEKMILTIISASIESGGKKDLVHTLATISALSSRWDTVSKALLLSLDSPNHND